MERVIPAIGLGRRRRPTDTSVRPNPDYTMISSPDRPDGSSSRRNGVLYAFDAKNHRVVAFNKANGKYIEQYRPAGDANAWEDLQGFVVLPAPDAEAPSSMWWISLDGPPQLAPRGGRRARRVAEPGRERQASPGTTPHEAEPDSQAVTTVVAAARP